MTENNIHQHNSERVKKNFEEMMEIIDRNKDNIPEGDYINFCRAIKGNFDSTDTASLQNENNELIEEIEELEEDNVGLGKYIDKQHNRNLKLIKKLNIRTQFLKRAYNCNKGNNKIFSKTEERFLYNILDTEERGKRRCNNRDKVPFDYDTLTYENFGSMIESRIVKLPEDMTIDDMPSMLKRLL